MSDACLGLSDGYHCLANFTQSVRCLSEHVAPNAQGMTQSAATTVACACDGTTGYCATNMDMRDPVVVAGLALTATMIMWLLVAAIRLVERVILPYTRDTDRVQA